MISKIKISQLVKLVVIWLCSTSFLMTCTSKKISKSIKDTSYRKDYFVLLNNNKQIKLENQKLKHHNKILTSMNLAKVIRLYDLPKKSVEDTTSVFTEKLKDAIQFSHIKINKSFTKASDVLEGFGVIMKKEYDKITFLIPKADIFIQNSRELTPKGKETIDALKDFIDECGNLEMEIVNFTLDENETRNIYYEDIFDLADDQNDEIRRSLVECSSLQLHDISTRICDIKEKRTGNVEVISHVSSELSYHKLEHEE